MVAVSLLAPPSLSAEQVYCVAAWSMAMVTGSQPLDVTGDCASLTAQLRVTSLVYQPFAPCVLWISEVMTGGVLSIIKLIAWTSMSNGPTCFGFAQTTRTRPP